MSLPNSYAAQDYWRRYLPFLPEVMRLPRDPDEEWWKWRGTNVHLDRLDAEDASLKVIVLHGGGGTGRLVSTFGALVHGLGYSYVAPDLPGFGLTVPGPDYDPHYHSWVELVTDLVAHETRTRHKQIPVKSNDANPKRFQFSKSAVFDYAVRCDGRMPGI